MASSPTRCSRQLTTELKANAGSVPSTLGGGQHDGHLGSHFVVPHPVHDSCTCMRQSGPFIPPVPPGTAAQIEATQNVWRELKNTFELCQETEKALVAQIVEAIDPTYLRPLLNRATGQYSINLCAVITHFFATHDGKITPQQVTAREQSVYAMHYDISQPIDFVFNTIEELADLADHGNSPMPAQQQSNLTYIIFACQPILQHDVCLWQRCPVIERMGANMLTHFREAQSDQSSFLLLIMSIINNHLVKPTILPPWLSLLLNISSN